MWISIDEEDAPHPSGASYFAAARRNLRRPVQFDAIIIDKSNQRGTTTLIDLSTSGALIRHSAMTLTIGEKINISIHGQDGVREFNFTLSARVVRIDTLGIGIQFESYDNATYTQLTDALYNR